MADTKETVYINKLCVMQVLAGLIKNPLLFSNSTYKFDIEDFPEQFHKIVFGAVEYLARSGIESISFIDIDKFLQSYEKQYYVFCSNKGIEYIQKILELYDPKKFDYYYKMLKKYSALVYLQNLGISTKDLYDPTIVDPTEQQKMQEAFDNMDVNDILLNEEAKILVAKERFGSNSDLVEGLMGDDLLELKEQYKKTPEMGMPLTSSLLTSLFRGQRKGTLYLESAPSGAGKTRRAVSEACNLAIPERYDLIKKQWIEYKRPAENVLIINTELELSEVQTIAIAYISGVNESHILDGAYLRDEEERVDKAIELIKKSKLFFVSITNYNIDDIVNTIKKYHQINKVDYVFFDYLGESPKMLASGVSKTKVASLRTDQVLGAATQALKDCAKQLYIYIWSATQLSGNFKDAKEADASYLRSSKAMADKIDVGTIMLPVREADKMIIESCCNKGFELLPNFVIHVYKIRRGSYQNIKVYVNFDRGTGRLQDCFVTDSNGVVLPVTPTTVEFIMDQTKTEKLEETSGLVELSEIMDF